MLAALLLLASAVGSSAATNILPEEYRRGLQARAAQLESRQLSNTTGVASNSTDGYRYLNNGTQPFLVESMPDVPFPIGEMYAGSLPITREGNTINGTGDLFFVFKPSSADPVDELVIWLNGGPGWSSMEGFFQEIGPVMWGKGTWGPVANAYAWTNLTNVIWVDQPISTGFSVGTPTATNENDVADQFLAFLANFEDQFGIQNYKVYLTGESYAGMYIPYIGAGMLDRNDTRYFNLSGALIYDPSINGQIPAAAVPFIQANARLLNYNETFLSELEAIHESCGFPEYMDQYLTYPPNGTQPPITTNSTCKVTAAAGLAEVDLNPCFSIYDIREACPTRYDPLGHSTDYTYNPPDVQPYFNRSDVKQAFHAPEVTWILDNGGENTFAGGSDLSEPPIFDVLPKVIEATGRVLIANGDFDMIINTNTTLLSIQNMTWNGQLGFQSKPSDDFEISYVDLQYNPEWVAGGFLGEPFTTAGDPQGIMGIKHYERGLMWCEVFQGGHSLPATQPRAAYRHLQWLLGRIDDL